MVLSLAILYLLMIFLNSYTLMHAYSHARRLSSMMWAFCLLVISFFSFYFLTLEMTRRQNDALFIIIGLLLFIFSNVLWRYEDHHTKTSITISSIKESFDNLPMGLCFYKENGIILLSNHVMEQLAYDMMNQTLQDGNKLWESFKLETSTGQITSHNKNNTWQIHCKQIELEETNVYQLTAINTTELNQLSWKLQQQLHELQALNKRLKLFDAKVIEVMMMEERLTIKDQLHRELGRMLVAARKWLLFPSPEDELSYIVSVWKDNIEALLNSQILSSVTSLDDLIEYSKEVGLKLHFETEVIDEVLSYDFFVFLLVEAINNAIQHSSASELFVKINEIDEDIEIIIRNNGITTPEKIQEGGGLTTIRTKVERVGGQMTVNNLPEFEIKIVLKKKGLI